MSKSVDKPVVVTTAANELEAAMVVAALERAGISSRPTGEFTSAFRAEAPGRVKVIVRADDADCARQALAAIEPVVEQDHSEKSFTHFDDTGASRMVDVGDKPVTQRTARASGIVRMQPETRGLILDRKLAKGDVLEVARLAGILAAKRTGELIPLCHPLPLESVSVEFMPLDDDAVRIEATATVTAKTGVEMETLTAVSVAALTMYDMCKSVDRTMRVEQIQLEEKSGGRSGHFLRKRPSQDS